MHNPSVSHPRTRWLSRALYEVPPGEIEGDDAGPDEHTDAESAGQPIENTAWGACPHIDRNDARCGHRFSIGRLEQAFSVCFGSYRGCPVFHRIGGEIAVDDDAQRPRTLVEVRILAGGSAAGPRTLAGGNAGLEPLRRTGS